MKIKKFFNRIAPLFLVVMMLCMTLSVTALAAEAVVPDGWTVLGNGEEFTAYGNFNSKYLIPVTPGVSYTVSGDKAKFAVFNGVTADGSVVTIGRANEMDNTYIADGTYAFIAISCYNEPYISVNVTWPEPEPPSIFDDALAWVGFLGDAAAEVFDIVMSHPLPRLGLILLLGGIAVFILRGFTPFI